jgi:proline iminopeptidase
VRPAALLAFAWLAACEQAGETGNLVPPTVDEDHSLPSLALGDTRLHLQRAGPEDAPLVVLLHGGPGDDSRYIQPLTGRVDGWALADEHEVVIFDQRGSGLSRRHDGDDISLAIYLHDLEALVDRFAPNERVILIGHSWGGMYAAMYMNAHPDRIAGAVLLEPGGLSSELAGDDDTDFDFTSEWLSDFAWGRQLVTMTDHAQADYYLNVGALADFQPQRHDDFSPWWRFGAQVKLELILGELLEDYDFTEQLGEIDREVLFVVGERTEDLGEAQQRRQLEVFEHASLAVVPDAGHSDLTWSHADASLRLVRDYLARIEGP